MNTGKRICFVIICLFALSFLTFSSISYAAEPLSPANGAIIKTLTPELKWSIDASASKYDIWLMKKSKKMFGLYVFQARFIRASNETGFKIKTGVLEDNSDYLWMVRSVTRTSLLGNFGKTFKFSVALSQGTTAQQPQTGPATGGTTSDLNTLQGLITAIKSKFGITMENGTAEWTLANLRSIYNMFLKFPAKFYNCTKYIQRISTTSLGAGVGGYVNGGDPSRLYMTTLGVNYDLCAIVVHEMTHCFQLNGNAGVLNSWASQFWGARNAYSGQLQAVSAPPTEYGRTNVYEDMAESVRLYFSSPSSLKTSYSDRYQFIKNYIMNGVEF